jgi:phage gpG-like protein
VAGVVGNFSGLALLRGRVGHLQTAAMRAELAQVMGAAAMKEYSDGFRKSRDPYGNKWAPLKLRRGKPLQNTGRLRASAALNAAHDGFTIVVTADYASTHQRGAVIVPKRKRLLAWRVGRRRFFAKRVYVPKRQMLPEARTGGLGPIWTKAIATAGQELLNRQFQLKGGAK